MISLVLLFAVGAFARPETCDYTPWSQCEGTSLCHKGHNVAFKLQETTYDVGREVMKTMMAKKIESARLRQECRDAGECPELMGNMPTEGPITCSAGVSAGTYPGSSTSKSCSNVDQVAFLSLDELDLTSGLISGRESNDVWGWTDPVNGEEYVIMGLTTGTSFVRISPDPENPTVVAFMLTKTQTSTWRDIKVVNNYAFVGSEARQHGIQVFDLTRLRGQTNLGLVEEDVDYVRVGNTHNIVANEDSGFVYAVGATEGGGLYEPCSAGLHFIDATNPADPFFAGCYSADGYTHDAQCVNYNGPDVNYVGREVCFAYNEDSLTIVDVTNKASPSLISKVTYPNFSYTHQGWVTEDHTTVLLDDETDEYYSTAGSQNTRTYVWDVSTLSNPVLKSTHVSNQISIDHNQYIVGDLTYQSNYESGLRILRVDQNAYTLTEVGHFDVYPGAGADFYGTWSNYPYFASGVVALTSIEYGLYLVRPNIAAMEMAYESNLTGTQTRSSWNSQQCPMQTQACEAPKCY
ncbi:unnamed protein product [Owenia fusiformis]|uniref:Uncharacterized protein n=1 Tax=Owenia fusiformis TaxID=6347 RepID=A0A8S4PVP3_OWEFU|nr:unnamed protein product [Owenia fusiformis]